MIQLNFKGWFQCRLATDPDPADEPRGVSGYMKTLAGEPDLDRIIRLQPPFYQRSHTPLIGVQVYEVLNNGIKDEGSLLNGATINLLDNPIFKGENGIVAEDGAEPIVPFVVEIKKDMLSIIRRCPSEPDYLEFPFIGLQAFDISRDMREVSTATGIDDFKLYIQDRLSKLQKDLEYETDDTLRDVLRRRIAFLQTGSAIFFFEFMMKYRVPLSGEVLIKDDEGQLKNGIDTSQDWLIEFWMGGWDADAASGFMQGRLTIT